MARCFVIQPFDKGAYDKRYEDVLVPAIEQAGLTDYRVDRDPTSTVLIESIEEGIRDSDACIAEITTNNPNVWYELGYAIANGKPLVMICNTNERRGEYPFDIRHRTVIKYAPESPRDFQRLQREITSRLSAPLRKRAEVQTIADMSPLKTVGGLSPHEMAALKIVMENRLAAGSTMSAHLIREEMTDAGFTKVAAALSLEALVRRGLLAPGEDADDWGNPYWVYSVTERGVEWLLTNQSLLEMTKRNHIGAQPMTSDDRGSAEISDDDVPF